MKKLKEISSSKPDESDSIVSGIKQLYYELGEDWHLWDDEANPYPIERVFSAFRNFMDRYGLEGNENKTDETYQIRVDSVSKFRYELIKMIEGVRYNVGDYVGLTSSQIAEEFEGRINGNIK